MIEDSPDLHSRTRVAHNLILWGKAYGISVNTTPNLEVLNNIIVQNDGGPFHTSHGLFFKSKQESLVMKDNAVYSYAHSDTDLDDRSRYGYRIIRVTRDDKRRNRKNNVFEGNYQAGGGGIEGTRFYSDLHGSPIDITDLGAGGQLFENGTTGNDNVVNGTLSEAFKIASDITNPNLGVGDEHLMILDEMIERYGVDVKYSNYCEDPITQMKLIIDNAEDAGWLPTTDGSFLTLNKNINPDKGVYFDSYSFTWTKGEDTQTFSSPKGYAMWIAKTTLSADEYAMWISEETRTETVDQTVKEELDAMVEKMNAVASNPTLPRDHNDFQTLMDKCLPIVTGDGALPANPS